MWLRLHATYPTLSEWRLSSLSVFDFATNFTLENGSLDIVDRRADVELGLGEGEAVAEEAPPVRLLGVRGVTIPLLMNPDPEFPKS